MDDGEEDGVLRRRPALRVLALAEYKAKGIGRLVPCPSLLRFVCFGGFGVQKAGELRWIRQIGGCEAVAEQFGEGAAAGRGVAGVGEIVVDVRFACWGEEEKPVLFDIGPG